MTADLERAFDQLRGHTTTLKLPPAGAIRRRGDRRRRARATVGLLSVVVVVLMVSGGAVALLGAPRTVQPAPPVTSGPVPSVTESAPPPRVEQAAPAPGEPATFPTGCFGDPDAVGLDVNTGGDTLPATMMLTAADLGPCYTLLADEAGYDLDKIFRPEVCPGQAYASTDDREAGRTRIFTMGPENASSEVLVRYAPGRAAAFMADVRNRVAACATHELPGGTGYSLILDSGFAGDDSLLVYVGEDPAGGYPGLITALIRVGDIVAFIENGGDRGVEPERDLDVARKAAAYLR
jgi:hypothetical protein